MEGGTPLAAVAAQVRTALGPAQPPKSPEDAVGAQTAAVLRECADASASALHARLIAAARTAAPGIRITVHGSASPWATGAFAPLGPRVAEGIDAVVANCWAADSGSGSGSRPEPGPASGGGPVAALRDLAPPATAVGGYFRPETLPAGLGEAHLYHLGLVPLAGPRRRPAARVSRTVCGNGSSESHANDHGTSPDRSPGRP
ncbi:hypothetical protein OG765_01790 [Streptomyces sp. NBC_00555]|uniref:hypothetical protein n=1 Tax=Streptomyces sp. NBC_00555 TaxID=2903662 RepID=UPI00225B4370|nr:hypothetical protein [Streptomyces sp. NBC_00555]MCX5009723.1 hypothetical protein [Streptomyces sp. NBC_00555]